MEMKPARVVIALPFSDPERAPFYACGEAEVDFLAADPAPAVRCTLSFAAAELARVLSALGYACVYASEPGGDLTLRLSVRSAAGRDCAYAFRREGNVVDLIGESRVGTLYAAWDFLRLQGVRWYEPGPEGEHLPAPGKPLLLPDGEQTRAPAMPDGRGFDIFAPLKDSEQFLLWMARNRMNACALHELTRPLACKLGMLQRIGGHMFEPWLLPDVTLEDGRTIWESHREWYGQPAAGERTKKDAQKIQFCVSQKSLADYLASKIIKKLRGEWKYLDRLDIWGFDTWGGACSCGACRALGNSTDRALYFLSQLRGRLDAAGERVTLVGCAYEGTDTMDPPSRPVPENLLGRDLVVHYPIHRCYAHRFDDPSCPVNAPYFSKLSGWRDRAPRLTTMLGEYYNVTKFEDLPLVFARRIREDLPTYAGMGVTAFTYMHPPIINLGFRSLNHVLIAELAWDPAADAEKITRDYFETLYGPLAARVREIYDLTEAASMNAAACRAWHIGVLDSMQAWDGSENLPPLSLSGHFADEDALLESLDRNTALRREALEKTRALLRERRRLPAALGHTDVNNPAQLALLNRPEPITGRLAELKRSLIYGADEAELFAAVVRSWVMFSRGEDFSELFRRVEELYDAMESYYVPMRYVSRKAEAFCDDALTRSQLRGIADRLRAYVRG